MRGLDACFGLALLLALGWPLGVRAQMDFGGLDLSSEGEEEEDSGDLSGFGLDLTGDDHVHQLIGSNRAVAERARVDVVTPERGNQPRVLAARQIHRQRRGWKRLVESLEMQAGRAPHCSDS